ncbi:MAG: helix-hairpin-helix domain-containing protein [bacterium]|nr:helix-hairpin-helix domain-containing protein [bacterium]
MNAYFNFTKGERNAFVFVVIVILVIALVPFFLFNEKPPSQVEYTLLDEIEASSSDTLNKKENGEQFQEYPEKVYDKNKFQFNPNTASEKELQDLGFKPYISQRIVKFRNAGGQFKIKSDLYKIYGINPGFVESILPYVDLPEVNEQKEGKWVAKAYAKPITPELIDLNTCDTQALNRLRGIGNKLSQRIVSFREKLGGFYSLDQLNEVYGLQPEVIENIKPRFSNNLMPNRFIEINSISVEELGQHPYVKKALAQIIINYRTQHGPFKSVDDLLNVKVLDEKALEKIKNYIKL